MITKLVKFSRKQLFFVIPVFISLILIKPSSGYTEKIGENTQWPNPPFNHWYVCNLNGAVDDKGRVSCLYKFGSTPNYYCVARGEGGVATTIYVYVGRRLDDSFNWFYQDTINIDGQTVYRLRVAPDSTADGSLITTDKAADGDTLWIYPSSKELIPGECLDLWRNPL